MVRIASPRLTTEAVQDQVGQALEDGLGYDDGANRIDVETGGAVVIDGSGAVNLSDADLATETMVNNSTFAPGF